MAVCCFWMVRRDALNTVGLLDERFFMYAEDMDWCKRFRIEKWDIIFCPLAQAIHYGGVSSSAEPLRFYMEKERANMQYWDKYHSHISRIVYRGIIIIHHLFRIMGYMILYVKEGFKGEKLAYKVRRSWRSIRWLVNNCNKLDTPVVSHYYK